METLHYTASCTHVPFKWTPKKNRNRNDLCFSLSAGVVQQQQRWAVICKYRQHHCHCGYWYWIDTSAIKSIFCFCPLSFACGPLNCVKCTFLEMKIYTHCEKCLNLLVFKFVLFIIYHTFKQQKLTQTALKTLQVCIKTDVSKFTKI